MVCSCLLADIFVWFWFLGNIVPILLFSEKIG